MSSLTLEDGGPGGALRLVGQVDRHAVPAVQDRLLRLAAEGQVDLRLDLSAVSRVDTAGVAFLRVLDDRCRRRGRRLQLVALSEPARHAFELLRIVDVPPVEAGRRIGRFERLGAAAWGWWDALVVFLMLTADTFVWSFGGATRTRQVRRGAAWTEAVRIGLDALPIVGLIALLIGVVLALQSAYQLRQFGGSIYMATLIAVSMTREMGPLITAIIVAGRSGASIAAEVATMQVSEEIAALRTMGLSPVRYIVVPKFKAITMTLPALTVMANVIGIAGGAVVALVYLEISMPIYFRQAWNALVMLDIVTGLLKSVVFSWIVVLIAAYKGFMAHGGAESVGRLTTESVVSSIFWVIVADAAFSLVFYFGD